jgi:hypothetical protein
MKTDHLTEFLRTQNLKYNKSRRCIFIGDRPMTNNDITRFVLATAVNGKLKRSVVFNAALQEAHKHDYSETDWIRK